jgi:TIGR03009 family protein
MRYSWLALGGLLAWQTAGWAQLPAQNPPALPAQTPPVTPALPAAAPTLDPSRDPLDAVLVNWEAAMKKVDTLQAPQCSRQENRKTLMVTKTYVGIAKYLRPNMGLLYMSQKDKPDSFEEIIVSGSTLYQFAPLEKEVRAHRLPPSKTGMGDDSFLSFLFGMKAVEAKARYDLKLVQEDQYYYYLGVSPRREEDKADFRAARLVLNKDSMMPRQLWFEQPNGDTVTWDFPKIETGVRLNPNEFAKPALPQGWKLVDVPAREQPRIIRQGGQ